MLSHILGLIEAFERTHGRRPQVIYLNAHHMHQLMAECPDLFDQRTAIPLGFRIVILPESELAHPKAVWLPPRQRETRHTRQQSSSDLISYNGEPRNRTER